MSVPLPAASLLLALLAATSATAQPVSDTRDMAGPRHLELTADAAQQPEVRISPHLTTNLVFNAPLQRGGVLVGERGHFRAVTVDEAAGLITLLPSDALAPGARVPLTVRFADGAAPESITFQLVVHPTRAEQQVQVYRQPRSAESYREEARREHERAERCEARLAQVESRRSGGLTGLFDAGLMNKGGGIVGRDISVNIRPSPDETLQVPGAYSYRAESGSRVAVQLKVWNTGTRPWMADGAELVSNEGTRLRVVRVWQREPIAPGGRDQVVVEVEATEKQARGTFTLELAEKDGARTLTVHGVTFP